MGQNFLSMILVKYCKTDVAYTGLKSVKTKEKNDYMHSFSICRNIQILLSAVRAAENFRF